MWGRFGNPKEIDFAVKAEGNAILFVQPASSALFRLLFFMLIFVTIKLSASLFLWLFVCDVCFDEFCPSADMGVGMDESVGVLNLVLL